MPRTAYVQENGGSTEARQVDERAPAQVSQANGNRGTGSSPRNDSPDTSSGDPKSWSAAAMPTTREPEAVAFQRLERRDGVVLKIDEREGVFRARLVDPNTKEPDQEVEVEIDQVSPSDLDLLAPGALFFWAIGYVTRRTGRRNLVLQLDFRRLPRLGGDIEQRARRAGTQYVEEMNWS